MITKRFLLLVGSVSFALAFISTCSSKDVEDGLLEYGGQKYKTVVIDGQELMAENLNYDVPGSKCYNNDPANCAKYGRLYDWIMAMALPLSCNNISCANQVGTPHKGICPNSWHIPSNAEWDKLYHSADGTRGTKSPYDSPTAGKYLKAKEGWNNCGYSGSSSSSSSSGSDKPYLCEDTLGFAALPGGHGYPDGAGGGFNDAGEYGYWWSALEYDADASKAYGAYIYNRYENAYLGYNIKTYLLSVRCFKD